MTDSPETSQLTPTDRALHPTTVHQVLTQSRDPKAVQMSLNVPTGARSQGDTFNLDLARCSPSTIGQPVDLSAILDNSNLELVPTEAPIISESCANVVQTAGGSKINARSVLWAVLNDTLERCNAPAGDLMLGHYHHPMFHGSSTQEHPDI